MIKKTITFQDLDGNSITDTFWFNLSKADIAEMQLTTEGGLAEHLKTIAAAKNAGDLLQAFKMVVSASIGRRGADNVAFDKSEAISKSFMQSDAYSELFMEMVTDQEGTVILEFIKGVMPADLAKEIDKLDVSSLSAATLPSVDTELPGAESIEAKKPEGPKDPKDMTIDELRAAMKAKSDAINQQ